MNGDDRGRLRNIFTGNRTANGTIVIPPGHYHLDGLAPLLLAFGTKVVAHGAHFHFPTTLPDQAQRVHFKAANLKDFSWEGGHFHGQVFDPDKPENHWPPNANTRPILITTDSAGGTGNLKFLNIAADNVAGAVITVMGAEDPEDERHIVNHARDITIENCRFERCGKFMWDYGLLWQIMVWPEDFDLTARRHASRYFRHDLVHGPLHIKAGSNRIEFDNSSPLPLTPFHTGPDANRGHDWVCFFGDDLPTNLVRGKQYAVVESNPDCIRISESVGGTPLVFATAAGPKAKLIANLFQAHLALFAPSGSGPGKGAFDLVGCDRVTVRNNTFSALGDTMHIQKCRHITFRNNRITGSRMGAFFLAEFCENALVEDNHVDGTNGSRVMSVEKSCANVTVQRNTFVNGGRGSWINQPHNFVLSKNIFRNNTTKCEPDPRRGRRSFVTGGFEEWAELYFTTYEPGGTYGPVTISENTFECGAHAAHAISFEPGGREIVITKNHFGGPVCDIVG